MNKTLQDQLLIRGIAQSETAAFTRLRKLCFRPAVSHVIQNSGNRQDGEDVYSDAEMVLYTKATQGLVLRASVGTYMHCVCKRIWLMELRRRKRRQQVLSGMLPDMKVASWNLEGIPDDLQTEQLLSWVYQAVEELNPTKKTLLLLSAYSNMSGEEMARETGLKDRMVVKVKLSQARREVKGKLLQQLLSLN